MDKPKIITRAEREARKGKMRGLGDLVAKVTSAVGIKPCIPCQTTRKDFLNRLVPFSTTQSKPVVNLIPDGPTK